jgi:hypothetical protein
LQILHCVGSVRLGDYPEAISGVGFVAEEAEAFLQAELVFLRSSSQSSPHFFESGERSRYSDELSEVKQRESDFCPCEVPSPGLAQMSRFVSGVIGILRIGCESNRNRSGFQAFRSLHR